MRGWVSARAAFGRSSPFHTRCRLAVRVSMPWVQLGELGVRYMDLQTSLMAFRMGLSLIRRGRFSSRAETVLGGGWPEASATLVCTSARIDQPATWAAAATFLASAVLSATMP